ncbi:unnamed protein product [Paramecium pentaurelia]|uniref:Histidine kinase domain-containing protein n=1 Tax=Paramecium pentaurelia TaxID=43138 RepID=A0A8S1SEM7_9CILI|nr:unnamed protein product [Paramecium pentaurelia]
MLKFIKLFIPLLLNSLFAILSIIYLQLKGQQSYFLLSEVVCLILGATLNIIAQIQTKKHQIQQDYSPVFFIFLLLILFSSLLLLDYKQLSQNILSLLIGGMLILQKLKQTNQQHNIKIKMTKALLQSVTLLFILILVMTSQKQTHYHIEELTIISILIIVFLVFQLQPKKLDKKSQNKMISLTQNSTIQQINSYHLWEKFLEKSIFVVSSNNTDIVIEKISVYLEQYLKDKHYNIEDFLKNIQIIEISFENENIILNKMIEVKQSLYQYIKEILNNNNEKSKNNNPKNWKQQNQFQEDQSSKLMSPNESRSQLSIIYKQDSYSQKKCSLDNGNNALDQSTIEKELFNRSAKDLSLIFNNQLQQTYSPQIQNKVKLLGIFKYDKQNYKKITFNNQNQALIFEFEEESIEQLKQKLNDIQNQYKLIVTKIQCQRITLMLQELKVKLNQIINQNMDLKLLRQLQSQIYLINLCNNNFWYFLTDNFKERKPSQLNLNIFLNQIISKLNQDTVIIEKNIRISINDDELLMNEPVITHPQYLRLVIINLIYNSIKECSKTTDSSYSIYINLKQINKEDIQFEIIDDAGGFADKLDYSRVLMGKLGIFVCQKLLPYISEHPILKFKTIDQGGIRKGNLVSFQISKHVNEINNNSNKYSTQSIIKQDIQNVAKILQSY